VGSAGRATLELGEHYAYRLDKPELAEAPLRASLEGTMAVESAAVLLSLREDTVDPSARIAALEVLLREAKGRDALVLGRELGGVTAVDRTDLERADAIAATMIDDEGTSLDPWARLHVLRGHAEAARHDERAEAWISLASVGDDESASQDLLLHGLRAKVVAEGRDATDDAFMLAQELAGAADAPVAAVALDETLEGGDDPEARADALLARLAQGADATRESVAAAAGRALAAARRREAHALLAEVVRAEPKDLASWDALRIAARSAAAWEHVVRACDEIAEHTTGLARSEMLEEAAAVLMDHLGADDEAEKRLRRVVEADRSRPNSYHRLHDILAERGDTDALLDLVTKRIEVVDASEQLERLYYELARLHRARGELDDALTAIENLRMLDEQHVGGIALAVEIHVAREHWRDAVEALRAIAAADVPAEQKRISLLGAAEFLETKLDDPEGALQQLVQIEQLGLADGALFERMAALATRTDQHADAARAMLRAAERAEGAERASYYRKAAEVQASSLGERDGAISAYRQSLAIERTHLPTAVALARLLEGDALHSHANDFEYAIRAAMKRGIEPDHLHALRELSLWRRDRDLAHLAGRALVALRLVSRDALEDDGESTEILTRGIRGTLGAEDLAKLRDGEDAGPIAQLAELLYEPLAAVDRLEPGRFGAGRGDLVKRESDVREAVDAIASALGLEMGDFYHGGKDAARVVALPGKKGKTSWVVGSGVVAPLDPARRFQLGRHAMGARMGTSSIIQRTPDEAATLLFAATAAADALLDSGSGRSGLVEWTRALMKALPRKVRKQVATLAAQIPDGGRGVVAYCHAARRTALRSGLLLSGDLATTLRIVLDDEPTLGAVRASPEALDLLTFWLSPAMASLRKSLGLSA